MAPFSFVALFSTFTISFGCYQGYYLDPIPAPYVIDPLDRGVIYPSVPDKDPIYVLAKGKENDIQPPLPVGPTRPPQPLPGPRPKYGDTKDIIDNELGPFKIDGIRDLPQSTGQNVKVPGDLSCSFSWEDPQCCWHNVVNGNDELNWLLINQNPHPEKVAEVFRSWPLPEKQFIATGSVQTSSLTYAYLGSCPIICQKEPGRLSFDHWVTEGVAIDVCTLPVNGNAYSYCTTVWDREPVRQTVTIPVQPGPFTLAIVANEFTRWPVGIAAIDNIKYSGGLSDVEGCRGGPQPTVPPTPPDKDDVLEAICEAFSCKWTGGNEKLASMCSYGPLTSDDLTDHHLADGFEPVVRPAPGDGPSYLGNLGTGVLGIPNRGTAYVGGLSEPGRYLGMKSPPLDLPVDLELEFEFYESMEDVNLLACYDSLQDRDNCEVISENDVKVEDRGWRKGTFSLPKSDGRRPRKLYFLSENTGLQYGAVGIGTIRIFDSVTGLEKVCDDDEDYDY